MTTSNPVPVLPTQVRRPWTTTIRGIFQGVVAAAALAPVLVELGVVDVERLPWLGAIVLVAAAITRIMADPRIEAFLSLYVPWLAADASSGVGVEEADPVLAERIAEIEAAAANAPPADENANPPVE